jgi:hypothetical protein
VNLINLSLLLWLASVTLLEVLGIEDSTKEKYELIFKENWRVSAFQKSASIFLELLKKELWLTVLLGLDVVCLGVELSQVLFTEFPKDGLKHNV